MAGRGEGEAPFAAGGPTSHTPVLLKSVLAMLQPRAGTRYIDCTFGAGGYSRAILDSADCQLLALDRDPNAIQGAQAIVQRYSPRLVLKLARFGDLAEAARESGFSPADGVVFDIGVSSMQLDEAERGFSFMRDGPLDMRMSAQGLSAADVVNTFDEQDIAEILFVLGEERRSRPIARAIIRRRAERPFERTLDLADVIASVIPRRHDDTKHPATRSFQALRLFVNDELGELARGLIAAEQILGEGGRLLVVTFHSLEDRIAKSFFAERAGKTAKPSRHLPAAGASREPSFALLSRKAIEPDDAETAANPRARSARLRGGERTAAPPWPENLAALGVPMLKMSERRQGYRTFTKN
jgi:16S rRNA (cytosine1402-N4)-methyltransferase